MGCSRQLSFVGIVLIGEKRMATRMGVEDCRGLTGDCRIAEHPHEAASALCRMHAGRAKRVGCRYFYDLVRNKTAARGSCPRVSGNIGRTKQNVSRCLRGRGIRKQARKHIHMLIEKGNVQHRHLTWPSRKQAGRGRPWCGCHRCLLSILRAVTSAASWRQRTGGRHRRTLRRCWSH
ncbi:MAG: hypothetical protein JWM58_2482 [Rhizobium sp.]|nr:hypothetical protein [Rhizobium sp.]